MVSPRSSGLSSRLMIVYLCPLILQFSGCSKNSTPEDRVDLGRTDAVSILPSPEKISCQVDHLGSTSQKRQSISGGSAAPYAGVALTPGQVDAVGAIQYKQGLLTSQGCSGTLVTDRIVVTAGHCVIDFTKWNGDPATFDKYLLKPAEIFFIVGADIQNPRYTFAVEQILVNPAFTSIFAAKLEQDLALLVLKDSASAKVPGIEPIPLNSRPLDQTYLDQAVLSGGYGSRTCGDYAFSPVRYWAELKISAVLPKDLMVIGGAKGILTNGDSGVGLLMTVDGETRVVSVLSMGLDPTCKTIAGPRLDVARGWWVPLGASSCGETTIVGRCEGETATWCEGDKLAQMNCGAAGKQCGQDACQLFRCIAAPVEADAQCANLDYMGRCNGTVVEWCLEGKYQQRDCAEEGQTCGKSPDPWVGSTCLAASVGDAGMKDLVASDQGTVADLLSCDELQACITAACRKDYACLADCTSRASTATQVKYSIQLLCQYCTYTQDPSSCAISSPVYLKCLTPCAGGDSSPCEACVNEACAAEFAACSAN